MPQLAFSPTPEPLIFERVTVTVGDETVTRALFDARYDYHAKLFRGYVVHNGAVTRATCSLKPHEAACAVSGWVHGWITADQRTRLYHLARAVPKDRVIVEIGAWKGKSTAILGWGSKAGDHAAVWSVDPHEATPVYNIIHSGASHAASSWPQFAANLDAGGLLDVVKPLVLSSQQAAQLIREPVGLLFLDGDHDYAALDTVQWAGKIAPGGWLALHDTNWPPVQTALALLAESGQFEAPEHVDSMAVCQRKGNDHE